jgi:serine/threonine protein kinase/Tol biopolymer transport system component
MSLTRGTQLGPYTIDAPLGAGGMGEVYRARDARLHRDVAIKILPDAFGNDPDRRARFEREAHVLASLNHPNIAHVYGVEEWSRTPALVMELVEGRTLDELIPGLTLDDAIAIARQIAEALEAAHEQGIIHRDLKPSNVKVRDDGTVKVLDFGLAKALDASPGDRADAMNSPTLTGQATRAGVIIGTAAYMAPEQARAKPVDRRADIWAFGAVLYELLAGARAFGGDSVSDTLVGVLTKEPDWSKIRSDAPRSLVQLTTRCLRKDPRRRVQSMGDVRVALEEVAAPDSESPPAASPRSVWIQRIVAAFIVVAAAGAGAILTWSLRSPTARSPRDVPMHVAPDVALAVEDAPAFALSADGTMLAFVGGTGNTRRLYVRRIDAGPATEIAGTEGASSPFFSPDGQWVAFIANDSLKKVRVTGGSPPVRLTSAATDRGGVWLKDETIVYALNRLSPLYRVPADGGDAKALTQMGGDGRASHRFPTAVPEIRALLFTERKAGEGTSTVLAIDIDTRTQKTVLTDAYHPVYCPPGRLLFMREGSLFSAPFDPARLAVSGPETKIVDTLRASTDVGAAQYAATRAMLLYQPGRLVTNQDRGRIVWRATNGEERLLLPEVDSYRDPQFSPDGRRLAYAVLQSGQPTDLWILDRTRNLKTRLTHDPRVAEWWPVWSPNGRFIAYSETEHGIRMIRADGSGERQTLTRNHEQWQLPTSFSPDAKYLAYHEINRQTSGDIWILPLGQGSEAQAFLKTPFYEGLPMFSPNGRWIAYISNESGNFEIYVRPFPGPGAKHQISGDQTFDVHYWSADGTKLFYRSGDGRRMMSVPVRSEGAEFEFGKATVLFELDPVLYPDMQFWGSFAAAPDGTGFALVKREQPESAVRTYLMLKLDWQQ